MSQGTRNPSNGELTNSGTLDVALSTFDTASSGSSSAFVSTPDRDYAAGLASLNDRKIVGVAGATEGTLLGQSSSGGGQDAFFSVFDIEEGAAAIRENTQFGTQGHDTAIDIEAVGDSKFLVLWSEDHTSGDGSLTYRISAFAPDGRKLSPDP